MTTRSTAWAVRLAASAERDFQDIVAWTREQFGEEQALVYAATLSAAMGALTAGPAALGVKERSDIAKGLYSLHVASSGRRGRHFLMIRVGSNRNERWIEVLRILHDAMDLRRHVSSVNEPVEPR